MVADDVAVTVDVPDEALRPEARERGADRDADVGLAVAQPPGDEVGGGGWIDPLRRSAPLSLPGHGEEG